MLRILWNGSSAMRAEQDKLDCISNNLANLSTEGYKKENVEFSDLVYETLNRDGYPVSSNSQRAFDPYNGTGVKSGEWIRDDSDGPVVQTNSNTDFAISGEGYFKVVLGNPLSNGTNVAYERCGSFNVDSKGELVDKNGNRVSVLNDSGQEVNAVDSGANKVFFRAKDLNVLPNGEMFLKNGNTDVKVGNLNLYNTVGQDSMMSVGDSLYVLKPGVQPVHVVQGSTIQQGCIESSNVDLGSELAQMISSERAFEMNSKSLTVADQMWQMVNNMRAK